MGLFDIWGWLSFQVLENHYFDFFFTLNAQG